jgi:hypothetical protein
MPRHANCQLVIVACLLGNTVSNSGHVARSLIADAEGSHIIMKWRTSLKFTYILCCLLFGLFKEDYSTAWIIQCRMENMRKIINYPLKPKLIQIIFKNSVRIAKKTQHFTITKINWLTLFKEIIAVYRENHTRHISTVRTTEKSCSYIGRLY